MRAVLALALLFDVVGTASRGDDDPSARKLEERVEELEQKNRILERANDELRRRIDALEAGKAAPPIAAVAPTPMPMEVAPSEVELGIAETGLTTRYGNVRASFEIFGDAGFEDATPHAPDARAAFVFGTFDLMTSVLAGENFQAVSEIVGEGDTSNDEVGFDFERLWGKWTLDDRLSLKVGREHSPTNRWNRLFHHGRWLWIPATQPFLARFEDEGGFLPVHQVGIEAGGRFDSPLGMASYVTVVSNGRGRRPTEVTNVVDRNGAKAFDFGVGLAPALESRVHVGGNFHYDDIPSDPTDPLRVHSMRETIESGYVDFSVGGFDLISEAAFLQHADHTSGRDFHHATGYLQVAYRLGQLTPYTRFDDREMERGDPFFEPNDVDLDAWEQLFGLRYDLNANVAVKLEGGFGRLERRNDRAEVARRAARRVTFQLAWGF